MEFGGEFLFFGVDDFEIDMPIDMGRPGHGFVDFAFEVVPGDVADFEGAALNKGKGYIKGEEVGRVLHRRTIKLMLK